MRAALDERAAAPVPPTHVVIAGGLGRVPRLVASVEHAVDRERDGGAGRQARQAAASVAVSGAPEELVVIGTAVLGALGAQGDPLAAA